MIAENSIALKFETRLTPSGRNRVTVRAVFVVAVIQLGTLGTFAAIKAGKCDSRRFAAKHEGESEVVDARELLPLSWLENISSGLVCVPPSKNASRRAGGKF